MALHLPDKRLSQNDQKDSCIYSDGIDPSVLRIDGWLRAQSFTDNYLVYVRAIPALGQPPG
jgi:hypothetical protein